MTNFQGPASNENIREQLLTWLPAVLGVVVSLGIGGALVWPQWQKLQLAQQELEQLEEQRQRLPLLRAQLQKLDSNLAEAEARSKQILGLIAGSGEIQTFLAQLSQEAQRIGVQLDGYEPVVEQAPVDSAKEKRSGNKQKNTPPPPKDPLLAPGLKKVSVLLIVQGSGPQLLEFLRSLERLSLLVVQSNLQVKIDPAEAKKEGLKRPILRINLSMYAPADEAQAKPSTAASGSELP